MYFAVVNNYDTDWRTWSNIDVVSLTYDEPYDYSCVAICLADFCLSYGDLCNYVCGTF
ncbi:MAG: hypothetical protein ACQCN3_08980 [Candidatus Bathyarchaeia archaeon]